MCLFVACLQEYQILKVFIVKVNTAFTNGLSVVHVLHKQKQGSVFFPALSHSKLFLDPYQKRVTSKCGPFPCPPSYQLEWPRGNLLTSSSYSDYDTDSPAFVAGFQGSPLHRCIGQSRAFIVNVYAAQTGTGCASFPPVNESPHQYLRNNKYTGNYIKFPIRSGSLYC